MDLLREINNRVRSESGRFWTKLSDLAYDATIGLAKLYQKKTLEFIKISAASMYLQGLKMARKHMLLLFSGIFAVLVLAVTVVAVPLALVMVSPWTAGVKALLIAGIGLVYATATFLALRSVLSEEKWMKASGFQEFVDSIK